MKWFGVALGCVWLAAGCAAPAPRTPTPTPQTSSALATPTLQATAVVVQAAQPRRAAVPTPPRRPIAAASPAPAALPLSVLAGRSGADLRVALDLVLQEQVFLGAMATDAATSARLDELGGASDALDQNSLQFAELIGAAKGQATSQAVLEAWRGLVDDLIQYAGGRQSTATADIERRRPAIAAQLAMADLSEAAVDDLLRRRIQAQLALADSIVSHDLSQSSQRMRATAAASDELGLPLARAMATRLPEQVPPPVDGPDIDLRLGFARAFQEHAYLTGASLDAAADGRSADLQALVGAADANANDLGTQLASVYGDFAGNGLADRLKAETAALVSVASGGDRRQAVTNMDRLRGELDRALSGANVLLPPGLLTQQLRASDQPLLTAADAFLAREWATAFVRVRESARQSQKPADSLALSIVDRYPGRYLPYPPGSVER